MAELVPVRTRAERAEEEFEKLALGDATHLQTYAPDYYTASYDPEAVTVLGQRTEALPVARLAMTLIVTPPIELDDQIAVQRLGNFNPGSLRGFLSCDGGNATEMHVAYSDYEHPPVVAEWAVNELNHIRNWRLIHGQPK